MRTSKLKLALPLLACAALIATTAPAWSSPEQGTPAAATASAAAVKAADTVSGKVLGVSKKAKTITIEGVSGPVMLKFDEATTGMEHAATGEAAIVKFRLDGKNKVATEVKPKLAAAPEGTSEITTPEVQALVADPKGDYLLIDSRPAPRYAEAHIPTAISIPVEKMGELAKTMLPADRKDKMLIFYCGGPTCGLSPKAASMAVKMGFTNVKVMLQGAPGWKKAGQLMTADDKFVAEGNVVLIDLRTPEEATAGHMARAVNIPLAKLAESGEAFPKSKAAPIVLYGNGDEVKKGTKLIKELGFKTIAQVKGGLSGWQSGGHPLVKGPTATEINWVRILGADEVTTAEFEKALAGRTSGQLILDVRGKDEVAGGKFPTTVNIPLDEIEGRLAELPKDREILVHCTTGARAELAVGLLKKNGLKARFLVAEVECEDGECEVSE